jgi:hypothetical protein
VTVPADPVPIPADTERIAFYRRAWDEGDSAAG